MLAGLESFYPMVSMGKEWVRENEKRQEFLEVLYRNQCRRSGLYTGLYQGWLEKERDAWLEQDRIAQMAMAKVKGGKGMCGGGKKGK